MFSFFSDIADVFVEIITLENFLKAIQLLGFVAGGFILVKLLTFLIIRIFRRKISPQIGMLISKTITYTGVILIFFVVLHVLGLDMGILLGTAGVAGIALGFASQTSLSNFISGVFLITEKSFEIGDVIEVTGKTGIVSSIDLLSVKIRTFDNKYIRIPNESIIKTELTNITRYPIRRLDIPVTITYSNDLAKVEELLRQIALDNPYCLNNPDPLFIVNSFDKSGIDLLFGVWFAKTDFLLLKNSIMKEIKIKFRERNISFAYPHISVFPGAEASPIPVQIAQEKNDGANRKTV